MELYIWLMIAIGSVTLAALAIAIYVLVRPENSPAAAFSAVQAVSSATVVKKPLAVRMCRGECPRCSDVSQARFVKGNDLSVLLSSGSIYVNANPIVDQSKWQMGTMNRDVQFTALSYSSHHKLFIATVNNLDQYKNLCTSPVGLNWTTLDVQLAAPVTGMDCHDDRVVVTVQRRETYSVVYTSTDMLKWTESITSISSELRNVRHVPFLDKWIAIGDSGFVLTGTLNVGVFSWQVHQIESQNPLFSIDASVDNIVIGGNNLIATSPDGINWTTKTPQYAQGNYQHVTFVGSTILASYNSGYVRSSDNGLSWDNYGANPITVCAYDATSKIYLMAGTYCILAGADTSLTRRFGTGASSDVNNVIWSCALALPTGKYLLGGGQIALSLNFGVDWTWLVATLTHHLRASAYDPVTGYGYMVGDNGRVFVHHDDRSFHDFVLTGGRTMTDIIIMPENVSPRFIMLTGSTTILLCDTLEIGTEPTVIQLPYSLTSVTYNGTDRWVGVGDNGSIAYSNDAHTWKRLDRDSFKPTYYTKVVWTGSRYLAQSDNEPGFIHSSKKGDVWTFCATTPVGSTGSLYAQMIGVGANQSAIFGCQNSIVYRFNAHNQWIRLNASVPNQALHVALDQETILQVANDGLHLSTDLGVSTTSLRQTGKHRALAFNDTNTLAMTMDDINGSVYTSTDGYTFSMVCDHTLPTVRRLVHWKEQQWLACTSYQLMYSRNDGVEWKTLHSSEQPYQDDSGDTGELLCVRDDVILWVCAHLLHSSIDRGVTWTKSTWGSRILSVTPIGKSWILNTRDNHVYQSVDGDTWTVGPSLTGAFSYTMAEDPSGSGVLAVSLSWGINPHCMRLGTNVGDTWTDAGILNISAGYNGNGITRSGSHYVMRTFDSSVSSCWYVSSDGINWSMWSGGGNYSSSVINNIVSFKEGWLVSVGTSGRIHYAV